MLSRSKFLALTLPPLQGEECYCVVGIKDGSVRQKFVTSVNEISECADDLVAGKFNVFFALAKFATSSEGRTTKNASALKSFFVDLDCGPGKPYADISEGLAALKAFCKVVSMPRPTIVKSGLGAHIYWTLEEPLSRKDWAARAETLKDLCKQHKFPVDAAVTGDAARVLRVPDTFHVKDPTNPIKVEVLAAGAPIRIEDLDKVLPPALSQDFIPNRKFEPDPLTLSLMGNKQSRFRTILVKSVEGKGCAQLLHIFENQDKIEEPLWRAGLSIAERCLDRDKAIHVLSNKHPEYSPEETEKKAASTKGPYTCDTFRKLNPEKCEGCPHKLSSPIQLGSELVEATEEDNVVVQVDKATSEEKQYVIPQYPFPYVRGKNGGIYCRIKEENESGHEVEKLDLICEHDFYVVKRMIDPETGQTLVIRVHMPKDGVQDILLPLTSLVSKEQCIKTLAFNGITALNKRQDLLMAYVEKWVKKLQMETKADKAHKQYGWAEGNSEIIVGERAIRADCVEYSPPSSTTLPTVHLFRAKGDFHRWKDIINHYATPGQEYRAFPFFLGFGTLLMRFTSLDGFMVNLIGRNSGTGKSTVLEAINSIYGHPKGLMLNPKDTYNARMQRLGVMQNLAVTIDEITNMEPQQMSQQIYDVTSGRGKQRMKQHENAERANHTTFQTGLISSSNRSVLDALTSIKTMPDGEMKRIMEITYPDSSAEDANWARKHFEPIRSHYGHAIEPYAQAIIGQLSLTETALNEFRDRVDREAEVRQSERFWSLTVALAITGGTIAKQIGLHDIPIKPVFRYGIDLIRKSRDSVREHLFDADDFLGVYISRHFSEILIINGRKPANGLPPAPIKEPRGRLTARYEPDTKLLFVSVHSYKEECSKSQMNYEESLASYKKNKSLILHEGGEMSKRKRLFVGTTADNATQTTCLWFDTTKLGFFKEEVLLEKAAKYDIGD